jgi:acetoin utilization deacetylase AcuC-like enzyme
VSPAALVDLVYHPAYQASGLAHFSRLEKTHEQLLPKSLVRVHAPQPVDPQSLRTLHDERYVDAVLHGHMPLAGSAYLPWSPGLVDACLHMLGGQLLAAQLARQHGLAINLACGFHHSHPTRGGGFCVFNGLALVAQQHPELRVAVLDCDEHGGDGTEAFCALLPNFSAISIFGTRFGVRGGVRSRALAVPRKFEGGGARGRDYLAVLDQALHELLVAAPDLVLYQASADSHVQDPKSTLRLSSATLNERDWRVFRALLHAGIPVVVTVAGGYQQPAEVAALYLQTIQSASRALAANGPFVRAADRVTD